MAAPKEIADLVSRFEMHYEKYKSPHYNEADARGEFIDPFFEALGWDVGNRIGADEAYKDVLRESREGSGAPDYAFRYGERIRFYAEAKKTICKPRRKRRVRLPDPHLCLERLSSSIYLNRLRRVCSL